jgi:hypothetical protein
MGGFDLFGSNPLVAALEGNANVADDDVINKAFAGLDIGPMPTSAEHHAPPGFFVESLDRGFLDIPVHDSHSHMGYQSTAMGGIDTPAFQPGTQFQSSAQFPSAPNGMMNHQAPSFGMPPVSTMADQGDEWADLQLQLPSDFGEILGSDVFSEPPQQQTSNPPGFSGWGAFN